MGNVVHIDRERRPNQVMSWIPEGKRMLPRIMDTRPSASIIILTKQ